MFGWKKHEAESVIGENNRIMKIGVITTQYSPNYGALLQTFALQTYLKSNYGEGAAEVINYVPPHSKDFWSIYPTSGGYKNLLLRMYLWMHPGFVQKRKLLFQQFRRFIQKYIICTKEYYTLDELERLEGNYDILICGSDQIWNITRHDDPAWFLYFSKKWTGCTKIAYAPSVADKIPEGHEGNLKKYLENLDYISVRESDDVKQLVQYTSKDIYHVCDPVFLLSKEQWSNFLPENRIQEPYILCYFISTGDFAADVVKRIKEITGMKIVHVNVNIRDKFGADYDIRTASPFEFVSYIRNASLICTNSFHCTAFSVIFQKDFLVIPKHEANSRMASLMKKVGMSSRFISKQQLDNLSSEDLKIDYDNFDIQQWILDSKEFLKEAINGNE